MTESSATRPAKLALEDGTVFTGTAFGAHATRVGEVAFNTAMSGYQEIITDPSYRGQIVVMTCPQIGNYGVNSGDVESRGPQVEGFVVRELSRRVSNHRAEQSLGDWLAAAGIPGIADLDTRAITQKLRTQGALRGALSSEILDDAELVRTAREWPGLVGVDLVKCVAPSEAYEWSEGVNGQFAVHNSEFTVHSSQFTVPSAQCPVPSARPPVAGSQFSVASTQPIGSHLAVQRGASDPKSKIQNPKSHHVVVLDCGVKRNILRRLVSTGCRVTVVPPTSDAGAILDRRPDGVLVSNGPGDPEPLAGVIRTVGGLVGRVPLFGICLGHQLLALALGGRTFKLKFGHRGANQPVRNMATGRVEITSQNHGFAVDPDSIAACGLTATHVNLSDGTLEGFRHTSEPIFAVQYHPEASPGPHDATYLFDRFVEMMRTGRAPEGAAISSTS